VQEGRERKERGSNKDGGNTVTVQIWEKDPAWLITDERKNFKESEGDPKGKRFRKKKKKTERSSDKGRTEG